MQNKINKIVNSSNISYKIKGLFISLFIFRFFCLYTLTFDCKLFSFKPLISFKEVRILI